MTSERRTSRLLRFAVISMHVEEVSGSKNDVLGPKTSSRSLSRTTQTEISAMFSKRFHINFAADY